MADRSIVVSIIGDAAKFKKATDDAVSHSSKMGGAFGKMGGAVKAASMLMIGAVVAGAAAFVAFGVKSIGNAIEQERAWNRVKSVFGKGSADIIKWAETNSRALGVADDALELSVTSYVQWAKHAGQSTKDATTAAEAMAKRASEISLATGKSYDEVFTALQKGSAGAVKGVKEFGVVINAAAMEEFAYANGIAKRGEKLTEGEKVLARQGLILQQTASYTKDAAAMDGSYADSQRKLGVIIDEVQDTVGAAFLKVATGVMPIVLSAFDTLSKFVTANMPTIQKIISTATTVIGSALTFVATNVLPLVGKAIDWIVVNVVPALGKAFGWISTNVIPAIVGAIQWVSANIIPKLAVAFAWISSTVIPALGKAFGWIVANVLPPVRSAISFIVTNVVPPLAAVFGHIIENVIPALGNAFSFIRTRVFPPLQAAIGVVVTVISTIATAFNSIVTFISHLPGRIANAASGMWNGITAAFKGAINSIIRGWNGIRFGIPGFDVGPVHYGGFFLNVPNIPYLHAGGIVPGTPGANVLTMLQAGERVTSRANAGSGASVVVNIGSFIGSGQDVDRLADMIALRIRLTGAL